MIRTINGLSTDSGTEVLSAQDRRRSAEDFSNTVKKRIYCSSQGTIPRPKHQRQRLALIIRLKRRPRERKRFCVQLPYCPKSFALACLPVLGRNLRCRYECCVGWGKGTCGRLGSPSTRRPGDCRYRGAQCKIFCISMALIKIFCI